MPELQPVPDRQAILAAASQQVPSKRPTRKREQLHRGTRNNPSKHWRWLRVSVGGMFCGAALGSAMRIDAPSVMLATLISIAFAFGVTLVATALFKGTIRFQTKVITASGSFALFMAILWLLNGRSSVDESKIEQPGYGIVVMATEI